MSENRQPAWKRTAPAPKKLTVAPLEVRVYDNNVEQAMKVLDKKMAKEGVLAELKRRRHAEKPSEAKRRKHREAEKKARRLLSKKRKPYRPGVKKEGRENDKRTNE